MKLLDMGDLTLAGVPHTPDADMLGVQITPGRVRAAIVQDGSIVRRHDQPLAAGARPDEVMEAVVTGAQSLHAAPGAVGLAIPGDVDGSGRCWGLTGVLGFDGVYIAEEVAARLGCPVSIESDGSAAALAERTHGRAKGHSSTLTVLLGERLSAGLVLEGQLRRGSSGFGIALGHLRIDSSPDAALCSCGRRGCLAAQSGLSTARNAESWRALGAALGAGVALVQNVLDLDAVIITCPHSEMFRVIEPEIRTRLREQVFGSPASEVPLFESVLGVDAVLIGAATLAASIGAPPASR